MWNSPSRKGGITFGNIGLWLLWHVMHLFASICYFILGLKKSVESFLISLGLFKKYSYLDISKVKYLAIAIDSEEANHTQKLLDLLRWLEAMGFKNLCLYDVEGVLKKRRDALTLGNNTDTLLKKKIHLEFVSSSDSKMAIAKAANSLLTTRYLSSNSEKQKLTESDMIAALEEIGYDEPDPDLMLVYGPARCHFGFPAWRIRYTEIVHMGSLKSMKLGSLIKAIHRFSTVHQNYGK